MGSKIKVLLAVLFFVIFLSSPSPFVAPVFAESAEWKEEGTGGGDGKPGPVAVATIDPSEIMGKWKVSLTKGAAISDSGKKGSLSDKFYVVFDYPRYENEYWYTEGKIYEEDKLAESSAGGCYLNFRTRDNLLYFGFWFYNNDGNEYISIYGDMYYLRTVGKTAKVRMEGFFRFQAMEWDRGEWKWRTVEIGRGDILFRDKD